MNLLSQILAISLLITSVIKVADVYLELDKNLVKQSDNFEKQTKKILQNNKGHFSFLAAIFLLILTGLLNFYVLKNSLQIKEMRFRKDSYLCMKYLNQETTEYIVQMNQFNRVFRTLFLAYSTGVSAANIKLAIEITKKLRLVKHLNYIKKITFNSYCPDKLMSVHYFKNFPFETINPTQLKTQFDETTLLRKNQWSTILLKSPVNIRLKKAFCLKATFSVKSNLDLNIHLKEEEIPIKGFQSWRCSSG